MNRLSKLLCVIIAVAILLPCVACREPVVTIQGNVMTVKTQKDMDAWAAHHGTYRVDFCQKYNIEEVVIGKRVRYIPNHAFSRCETIKRVVLPNGVKEIGGSAFSHCKALEECDIPRSVEYIGSGVFEKCCSLTHIEFPPNIDAIYDCVLYECSNLQGVLEIPNSVRNIENHALDGTKIQRLIIHGALENIMGILCEEIPTLREIVFANHPPINISGQPDPFECFPGLVPGENPPTVYYLREYAHEWAPNGETEWNGFPLVCIDTLDDLPPLE